MRKLNIILAVALISLLALPAKAGLLLEPYLGYQGGTLKTSITGGGSEDFNFYGATLGGRVGLTLPLLFFGADYSLVAGGKVTGNGQNADASQSQLFLVGGIAIPLLRAWLGYGLMNDLSAKFSGGEMKFKGDALKLGVGFTGLPFVAINFEYIMNDYKKLSTVGGEGSIGGSNYYSSVKMNSLLVSVSLPFDL